MTLNSHCPGCGLAQLAVTGIISEPDGSWVCIPCDAKKGQVRAQSHMSIIPCPACVQGLSAVCGVCSGLASVRVPTSEIKVVDPKTFAKMTTQVLTEG